jgi:hypothetical protein
MAKLFVEHVFCLCFMSPDVNKNKSQCPVDNDGIKMMVILNHYESLASKQSISSKLC